MPIDLDKIDEATLALLYLTLHDDYRAWKSFDWDATDRLHTRGLIDDPRNKNKSLVFTAKGLRAAKAAFEKLFGQ
jgi:hypothetical protein